MLTEGCVASCRGVMCSRQKSQNACVAIMEGGAEYPRAEQVFAESRVTSTVIRRIPSCCVGSGAMLLAGHARRVRHRQSLTRKRLARSRITLLRVASFSEAWLLSCTSDAFCWVI